MVLLVDDYDGGDVGDVDDDDVGDEDFGDEDDADGNGRERMLH